MKYEIKYGPSYSLLEVSLEPNEIVVAEAGAMIYMTPQIAVRTRKKESESLWRSIKTTVLGGESFFVNEYIAERCSGKVGFAPAPVGDIQSLKVEAGRGFILQKSAYLASTEGIQLDTEWQGFKKGLFGQSLFMLKVSGEGQLFVNAFGAMDRHSLKTGESLIVDNYHLVAFDDTCRYDVKKFGGLKSTILGGEGLVTEIQGPGDVYIQTKNIREFAEWLWDILYARIESTIRRISDEKRNKSGPSFSFDRPKL
ncbi:TIGR00266 family protein [Candidatus Bathyarchaeota archaeon]|nr:TIGR00266 family protein [Candidatus Bathyarchaeota archaeon]MBS7617954.1 TIGR00266 family protein [Candidatus Bathyarchaeota archaeon]